MPALLKALADKYENKDFLAADPSQFMHRFSEPVDQELFAFVSAQLAFGRRELFIAKLNLLYEDVVKSGGGSFCLWLLSGAYKKFFPKSQKKFYRFFSLADMNALCGRLAQIAKKSGSLGAAVREAYDNANGSDAADHNAAANFGLAKNSGKSAAIGLAKSPQELRLAAALISLFPEIKCVSQNPKGACKKLHMFLRWMVRRGSPVDLGLWTWASAADLLVPLDTHVLQESARLGLIAPNAPASAKTAIELTKKMAEVFPCDPARADYALFGLGVDEEGS